MITEQVRKKYAVRFHNVDHYPVNICLHCGEEDDPETTRSWPVDADDDKICYACSMATMTLERIESAIARMYRESEYGSPEELNYFDALTIVILAIRDAEKDVPLDQIEEAERLKRAQRKVA